MATNYTIYLTCNDNLPEGKKCLSYRSLASKNGIARANIDIREIWTLVDLVAMSRFIYAVDSANTKRGLPFHIRICSP